MTSRLRTIVEQAAAEFARADGTRAGQRPAVDKWSAKEVIGPQNAEAKSVEARANGYASQLVLPDYLVIPWAEGKRANLDVAKSLANDFNASLTAAAITLLVFIG